MLPETFLEKMHIARETLDDVLLALYPALLASTNLVSTTRGETRELVGVLLEIKHPRARLSRTETRGKPFSCLGELLWYLSKDNRLDFIKYYLRRYAEDSEDGVRVHGGYGPRLFAQRGHNQIRNIIELLHSKPDTRRAVVQMFNAEDLAAPHIEIPCTTTLQFLVRDGRLHMLTTIRSNDAYMGLPHDVFCFTMLQEIIARSLGREVGIYKHFAGSMHLYESNADSVRDYIGEAVQARIEMPPMPQEDPWPSIEKLLEAERQIRSGGEIDAATCGVAPYWADLIRLLKIFAARDDSTRIDALKSAMSFKRYGSYIAARRNMQRQAT